jgi:Uma2 family endonuclease
MRQGTPKGFQEDRLWEEGFGEVSARQAELIGSAPTEPEAFLQWSAQLEREEGKFELSRGRVVCNMIYASSLHSRVLRNLVCELDRLLEPDRFDIGISDFAVQTPYGVRSPDVVVENARSCRVLSTTTPIFIAEVLSPSTEDADFTEKLEEYTAMDALQTYLICSQDEPRAWVWARQVDGTWPGRPLEMVGREGAIALGALGVQLTMAALFRGIPDAPAVE